MVSFLLSQRYEVDRLWIWGVGDPVNFENLATNFDQHLVSLYVRILIVEAVVLVCTIRRASKEGGTSVETVQEIKFLCRKDQMEELVAICVNF